eukprot:TRINITY_DN9846_c0_g1_i2.p2 TRINITY_DN9846_c0_g1~~TRINITY_DN9846_c0_g1_i2.p2  ORF type:complete len:142 (-),score=31.98 TRINITY_DN9846_c0_g1_i2:100-525(-)
MKAVMWLSVVLMASVLAAASALGQYAPFSIRRDGDTKDTVVAEMRTVSTGSEVRCELSYIAMDVPLDPTEQTPKQERERARELLGQLRGTCLHGQPPSYQGYWQFQVCVGREVQQFHDNERYLLGPNPTVTRFPGLSLIHI